MVSTHTKQVEVILSHKS